ncbi:hypothetical protein [Candidatus Methanosphaera massiliense]|mgnify:CR=1 FL=1|jgi:hypothetical protein|uniref:hypothetical protein n=1 Tax=Methanosphaera TaxID=2316 RepID=UPI0023801CA9|nr:hypothetical protein [Candidatus Methanosphaera massiliense]MDE4077960.1 hypothetical protein [Candidatus Methanosphaera massiliense]MDY2744886.1 hypothetical protein [Methanosphaera sp.]
MSRILKIILFIVGLIVFFEIGLFASYSLISSDSANPVDLVSVQLNGISDFVGSFSGEKDINDQNTMNITNDDDVALLLNNMTNLSVNLNSVTAKVSSEDPGNQTVTITATATKDAQVTSGGAIEIVPEQTYSITATAIGEVYSSGKVKINTSSISIKEKILLYNQNNNTSSNQSIDNLLQYAQNNTTATNTTAANNTSTSRARA